MTIKEKLLTAADIFSNLPSLETERLILRKMTLADAPDIYAYARDPEVSKYTVWDTPLSIEDTRAFVGCVIKNYENGMPENWGIVFKKDNRFIGTCGYFFWDIEHRRAEINYALSRQFSGRGLMTEAVRAVIRFGFETMRLNRIEAGCMLDNTGSERVMQKAGMTFEGIRREGVFAKGRFHDIKVYAILRKDI